MLNHLHLLDAISLLQSLADNSVDFICVDPPYHTTKLKFDQFPRIDWPLWWQEANRVLKPAGVVCVFASGPFTFAMHATNPQAWRYSLVWEKTSASRFYDANRRPLQAHEDILVFCREPRNSTYHPQKEVVVARKGTVNHEQVRSGHYNASAASTTWQEDGTRFPRTVLRFASVKKQLCINSTQKPLDLLRWLVRTYTNPGDVVVDTCAGSGTTAVACREEGRNWICSEVDPEQHAKAQKRLAEHCPQLNLTPPC